jgi:hypothetical protein
MTFSPFLSDGNCPLGKFPEVGAAGLDLDQAMSGTAELMQAVPRPCRAGVNHSATGRTLRSGSIHRLLDVHPAA